MNIEKLQMCRLCLVEDVRMFNVTNKDLQTLYEKLTDVPYVTEDSRPMLACVFCYTRLKQCCQLQRKCLEAEKMLTEMLNKDHETKRHIKQGLIEFVIAPTETIDIINEFQSRSNDIKEELPDDCEEHNDINEIKEEHQTEFEYQDSCPDLEDMTTNHSESDSEDDTLVMEFKIEEETDVSENKRRAEETQSVPAAKKPKLNVQEENIEDTISLKHIDKEKAKETENIKKSSTKATKRHIKQGLIEFVIAPTETIDIINEFQSRSNDIKEELPDDCEEHNDINEIKEEHQTEFEYQDSCPDLEDMTTNHSESDSEDDTLVMEFKIEEETDVSENKRRAEETSREEDLLRPDLYLRITRVADTITVQQKKTEWNTRKHTSTARDADTACNLELKKHSTSSISISNIMNNNTIASQDRKQTFVCDVCEQSFTTKSKLKNHFRIHDEKPYKCEMCQKSFNLEQNLKRHHRVHTGEKPYKCEICKNSFKDLYYLKRHIRLHSDEKPYKCEICQRSFSESGALKRHIRIHTGENPYKCDICQHSFGREQHLKRHHLIHTGEKPYKCEICQRSFIESGALKSHIRIHTGEKPYKCEICQHSFGREQNLKRHHLIHTGEKPYKCEICQRCFSEKGTLKSHIRIHTGEKPYKCEICQRCFSERGTLKSHIRIHTGEKPYKCEICQRCFSERGTLKSHIRIHTGEKPYKCEICQLSFIVLSHLKKHVRIHT